MVILTAGRNKLNGQKEDLSDSSTSTGQKLICVII